MSIRFYDESLKQKLLQWLPEGSNMRVYGPEETKKLYEITADDQMDSAFKLPFISLSRNNEVELLLNIKNSRSFDGFQLFDIETTDGGVATAQWNIIPIKLQYSLDIYTKTADDCDDYLRNFLFKLINNPVMIIEIPYNGLHLQHKTNIRVLNSVTDSSSITQRLFSGQFHRWTIQLELQDAFLFNVPYRKNWKLDGATLKFDSEDTLSQQSENTNK